MEDKCKLANAIGYKGKLAKLDVDQAKEIFAKRKNNLRTKTLLAEQVEINDAAIERSRQRAQ